MTKTDKPLMSLEASGKLADLLIYSKSKGRRYVKTYAKPHDPRSDLQQRIRLIMKFLAPNWSQLTTSQQQAWTGPAAELRHAPYHSFLSNNLGPWRSFAPPSKTWPLRRLGPAPASPGYMATAYCQTCIHHVYPPAGAIPWGLTIHRQLTYPNPSHLYNCVHFLLQDADDHIWYLEEDLAPATYYYRVKPFSADGVWGPHSTNRTVTIDPPP